MEHLQVISSLFEGDINHYLLLDELSKIGVIAGGSVVFALNQFVSKESVGDVDIFCPNEEKFWKALNCIIEYCGNNLKYYTYKCHNPCELSVLTIEIFNERVNYQLILKEFDTPIDIINDFDFDYVQCAIYSNEFYITKECKQSHNAKRILKFRDLRFRNDRPFKAIKKGFKCPVLINDNVFNFPLMEITFDKIKQRKVISFKSNPYFNEDREDEFLLTNAMVVTGFDFIKKWKDCVFFGKFIIDCGNNCKIKKSMITVEMNVINLDENGYIDIEDGQIKNMFESIKRKDQDLEINKGKNVFLIEAYMSCGKFKAKVIDVIENALPINISNKLNLTGLYESLIWTDVKPKYYKVMEEINNLNNKTESHKYKYKIDAYRCFLYHVKFDDEKNAIRIACRQMNSDHYKKSGDALMALSLTFFSSDICTIDKMIRFINGYA
jgi:hypothetical protein